LRDDRERFEAAGAEVAVIGLGRPQQARTFCDRYRVPFRCLTGPDRSAHRAFGLRRGTLNEVAGPPIWLRWLRNELTGRRQGRFGQGDPAQLGGTFVVDTRGVIRFAHRGRRSSDIASNDEVLAVVSALQEGT
jgi:peroxiredoxin